MDLSDTCQDAFSVEDTALLSYLYLDKVIYPFLTKNEYALTSGVWHRSYRFQLRMRTRLNAQIMQNGSGESRLISKTIEWQPSRFPQHDISERQFTRALSPLLSLGVLQRMERGFYRLACFPSHFMDEEESFHFTLEHSKDRRAPSLFQQVQRVVKGIERFQTI